MRTEYVIILLGLMVAVSGCTQQNADDATPDSEAPEQDMETSEPSEDMNDSTENRVVYTGSGFEPADLTVEVGETVTWVDQSGSGNMWIGSDRHPTHTQYAGSTLREHCSNGDQTSAAFDQCSTGERFSFTFEKTGEWGYHNHEQASQGGTITVVEN
jgi:plastocyanin